MADPKAPEPFSPHAWQVNAVAAFRALGGLFMAQPPGAGKSWVIGECLRGAERPLCIMPASARSQTRLMLEGYGVTSAYASYSQVSRDSELLNRYRPDVLAVDEAHALKNVRTSAWGRRIARYLHENPSCRVVASTGSVMHRGLADYAHLLVWALRGGAPCPTSQAGIERAALAVMLQPQAWLAKMLATPGVFLESAPSWAGELLIREHVLPISDDSAYARAAESSMAPDGWACEGFALTELLRQLSWGWYTGRDPRPSPALVEARAMWAKCVTQAKAYGLCDTELGARAHYPDAWRAYSAVLAREPEGEPVPVWLDPPLDMPWYVEAVPGTIVWVHHRAVGQDIADEMGWPYHTDGTLDAQGRRLDETDAPVVVASIAACHKSCNAQARFSHNIVLEPPADARVWQQLICRTARQGQKSPCVTVDIVIPSPTYAADLATARKLAAQIQLETGQTQLLLTEVKT